MPKGAITANVPMSGIRCHQIKDARPLIEDMEIEKRLDMAQVTRDAIKAVEETGIVFIDEIDKVGRGETIFHLCWSLVVFFYYDVEDVDDDVVHETCSDLRTPLRLFLMRSDSLWVRLACGFVL